MNIVFLLLATCPLAGAIEWHTWEIALIGGGGGLSFLLCLYTGIIFWMQQGKRRIILKEQKEERERRANESRSRRGAGRTSTTNSSKNAETKKTETEKSESSKPNKKKAKRSDAETMEEGDAIIEMVSVAAKSLLSRVGQNDPKAREELRRARSQRGTTK